MATIILESGEKFEHYHETESVTNYISGDLRYVDKDRDLSLKDCQTVVTPAGKSHTIINTGSEAAKFFCAHS